MKDPPLFLDYEQTNELIRILTDIQFKLLGAILTACVAVGSMVLENYTRALFVGFSGRCRTFVSYGIS